MRKPTEGQVALGASIAFAFWLFVALPLYYGPRNNTAANQTADAEREQSSHKESLWIPQDSTGFFALWTALFTGSRQSVCG